MGMFKNIQLLERIHDSILRKSTGKPEQFARRLNISESTLYRILKEVRDQGVKITFDYVRSSYKYENEEEAKSILKIHLLNNYR
jgi:predicted transcriptional regulator